MKIKKGDKIKVEYEGTLDSGEIFDSSFHGDHSHPLEFEVGSGEVIQGLDNAVLGMTVGEEKSFSIIPGDAYGELRPELKKSIPRKLLKSDQEPKTGMTLILKTPDEKQFQAKILSLEKDSITLDLNHPLAGKRLNFKIKVVSIN